MMIFFDFFLSQKFKEMVCRLLKNITKSTMENPKIWFIFRLDIILLGLGHLVNARKDVKNSKFNFNPKKKRFSKYLSVTVFGDLIMKNCIIWYYGWARMQKVPKLALFAKI